MKHFICVFGMGILLSTGLVWANGKTVKVGKMERLVEKQALTWNDNITESFYEGAFLGDGLQGAMVTADEEDSTALRILLGHYNAIAHHVIQGWEFCDSRVFCASLIIKPRGKLLHRSMKMDIWNGLVCGEMETSLGRLKWELTSDRQNKAIIVRVQGTGDEAGTMATVRPEWGITPYFYLEKGRKTEDYIDQLPPKPVTEKDEAGHELILNPMHDQGGHVVASARRGHELFLAIGADDSKPVSEAIGRAREDAVRRLENSMNLGYKEVKRHSCEWWHQYYASCSLEIPSDPKWERFWWLQLYKFACCSAEDSDLIIDTQGPWITASAWAAIWFNLNVQLSYMPMYTSVQTLRTGRSLINGLDRLYKSGVLNENAGGKGISISRAATQDGRGTWCVELGNMPWLLHCYWKYWQYSGDQSVAPNLFRMLQDSWAFLKTRMEKNAEGQWEMKPSLSPEYDGNLHPNANYALMSVRWVLTTLLQMNRELGMQAGDEAEWQSVLEGLSDYPVDENGFRIASDQPFSTGHRHYSHLIGFYPYHIITPEKDDNRKLLQTSLDHWQKLSRISGGEGYTYTGGCAMYATLGEGDQALECLNLFHDKKLMPNTMYREGGGQVVETPLSGVESINYMLLQSWDGIIRIFPALPGKWQEVSFRDMMTEGGFQVTASYSAGRIKASIRSLRGGVCRLKNPFPGEMEVRETSGRRVELRQEADRTFSFKTEKGKTYQLREH